MSDYALADAEARHAEAPRSFFIPDRAERESLRVGQVVRLLFEVLAPPNDGPSGERMWVEITDVVAGRYSGLLTNVPVAISTIGVGDRVDFGPEHVIGTLVDWPLLEKMVFVSRRSHVQDVRPGYVYREEPDQDRDSGWRALVGDETDEEVADADSILLQNLGFLLDRWPELRPVLETDPRHGEWAWDGAAGAYVSLPPRD